MKYAVLGYALLYLLAFNACKNKTGQILQVSELPVVAKEFELDAEAYDIYDFDTTDNFLMDCYVGEPKTLKGFKTIKLSDNHYLVIELRNIFGNNLMKLKLIKGRILMKENTINLNKLTFTQAHIEHNNEELKAYFKLSQNSTLKTVLYQYDYKSHHVGLYSDDGYTVWDKLN